LRELLRDLHVLVVLDLDSLFLIQLLWVNRVLQ